ncbi:MAG: cyclic nucleotide-binding domain-containing protein [Acidimicrobiia bacterium]|nr:cyclic nucleotide-binding domain-containing protein [Acidimicrobiia bacterium]
MGQSEDLISHLAEVPLFSRCSKRDLQTVTRHVEVIDIHGGAAVITQGQAGDAFYVLLEGAAVVRRNNRKVGELGRGDYFGELALLDPAPRNADVVATTDIKVARLDASSFRRMLRSVPAMNERLLAGLSRRIRDADRKSVE